MTASTSIFNELRSALENGRNPQVKNWFPLSTSFYPLIVVLIYILFVTKIGPKYMENRKPFQLKNILIAYNLLQVACSGFIVYQASVTAWKARYKLFCEPMNISTEPAALWMTTISWLYHLLKYAELSETIFFVLRKKFSQITVLHVYHHTFMIFMSWGIVQFSSNGSMIFSGFLNTFVHVIMYMYYLLAACGPQIQKYLWWKKYITMLQLVQFVVVLLYLIPHYIIKDCDISYKIVNAQMFAVVIFLILFLNFYRMEYTKRTTTIKDDMHKVKSN